MRVSVFIFTLLLAAALGAETPVEVSIYHADAVKPPLILEGGKTGLAFDLVEALNQIQSRYRFKLVLLPSARLTLYTLEPGKMDGILFSNLSWLGEAKSNFESTGAVLSDRDLYFSLSGPGMNGDFFRDLTSRSLAVVLGYHYRFADFVSGQDQLLKKFRISFVSDELRVIRMVLLGRAEVGVSAESTLNYFRSQSPAEYRSLYISTDPDTVYDRSILMDKKGPLRAAEINGFLKLLMDSGKMKTLFSRYGLTAP